MYIWSQLVRPKKWQPWADTLAYWKFDWNLDDEMWNANASGSNLSYGTVGSKHYIENTATWTSCVISIPENLISQIGAWDWAVSFYVYVPSASTNSPKFFWERYDGYSPRPWISMEYDYNTNMFVQLTWWSNASTTNTYQQNAWYNIVGTRISWTVKMYVNWQLAITPYTNTDDYTSWSWHVFYMMGRLWYNYGTLPVTWCKMSEVIYEKKWWTDQEVSNYYNLTKWNYWL